MATFDTEEPETLAKRIVAVWRTSARLVALGALAGALVTFSPQPAAAIGAALVVILTWELGRKR